MKASHRASLLQNYDYLTLDARLLSLSAGDPKGLMTIRYWVGVGETFQEKQALPYLYGCNLQIAFLSKCRWCPKAWILKSQFVSNFKNTSGLVKYAKTQCSWWYICVFLELVLILGVFRHCRQFYINVRQLKLISDIFMLIIGIWG